MNAAEKVTVKQKGLALLKRARADGMTVAALATLCQRTPDQVARYLADVCHPSPKVALRIVKALGSK